MANSLGSGFLEKVYENALALELRAAGFAVEQKRPIGVTYRGALVGEYFADLLVEDAILIELKTVRAIDSAHRAQCINYLRATGKRLCLLINLGRPRIEVQPIADDPWRSDSAAHRTALSLFIGAHRCSSALSLSFGSSGDRVGGFGGS